MHKKVNLKLLMEIFLAFFKIGSFTFGGGYAMIPLIEKEVINNKGWVKEEEVIDVFAVAQSIPGAIAINSSTFIGYKIAGRIGAIVATLGVILPSFTIITIIAAFFARFQDNPIVQAAFAGIRPAIIGLILMAAFKIVRASVKDKTGAFIVSGTVILIVIFDVHAILMILGGALVGIVIYYVLPEQAQTIIKREGEKVDLP